MARKMTLRCLTRIIIVGLFLSGTAQGTEYAYDFQRIVDLDKPILLDLTLVAGKVEVVGSEDNRLVIDAIKVVRASNRDEADEVAQHIEIRINEASDRVVVNTNYLNMLNRSPSFWRKIIGGGDKSFSDVQYRVQLPFNCSVRISAKQADVELSNIEGAVEIEMSAGSSKAEFIIGPVSIRQPMGVIDLQWIEGDINIRSQSSKITVQQTRGAINLTTYSGNVIVQTELDSHSDYSVETTSGDIRFIVPAGAAGDLSIETKSGSISSEIPVEIHNMARDKMSGRFGGGGTKVRLNSSTGDVVLALY